MAFVDKNADVRAYIQQAYNGDKDVAYNDFKTLLDQTPDNRISFKKATKASMTLCYAGASILLFQQMMTAPLSLFVLSATMIGTAAIALTLAAAYKTYNIHTTPSREHVIFNKIASLAKVQNTQSRQNQMHHKWRLISQM